MTPWGPPEGQERLQDSSLQGSYQSCQLKIGHSAAPGLCAATVPVDVRTSVTSARLSSKGHVSRYSSFQSFSPKVPPRDPPSGPGPGRIRSLIRKNFGAFSVFCKVRLELLRPILDLLDPVKHLRMCS